MSKASERDVEARRQAQALLGRKKQSEAERMTDREKARRAEDAKTARLRDLRLQKEAADREAAKVAPAPAKRKPRAT
jgi:hypothetical protein